MATAGSARVSVASAREMASGFAATGKIGQDLYGDLIVAASRYARTTGTEAPEAAAKLAEALSDPVAGAIELNKRLGFLSGTTLELIERQAAMGDKAGAQKTVLEAMKGALVGVTDQTNGWALAWDKVWRAAKDAYDATGKTVTRLFAPTTEQQIEDLRARLNAAPRRGLTPDQLAARDRRNALGEDDLKELLERQLFAGLNTTLGQRQGESADASLKAKSIIGQLAPAQADLLRLQEFQTELRKTLDLGGAPTGAAEALARVTDLLKAGGTEAFNLGRAARDAFDQAGLLPYQRGLAEIEARYRQLIVNANNNQVVIAGLEKARGDELGAYRTQALTNPARDYGMRVTELVGGLAVQKEAMFATAEVAGTLAARQDLVNDAIRKGIDPVEAYGGKIDELAARMGKAKAAEEDFNRVRSNIVGGMDDLRSGGRGAVTGVFSDLRTGRNPLEGLADRLGSVADRLFDRTVSKPLIEGLLGPDGKAGGGLFGNAASTIFGDLSSVTTPAMTVTATAVTIGGLGDVGGIGSAVRGATGDVRVRLPAANDDEAGLPLPPARPVDLTPTLDVNGSGAVGASAGRGSALATVLTGSGKVADRLGEDVAGAGVDVSASIRGAGDQAAGALKDTEEGVTQGGSLLEGAIGSLSRLFDSSGSLGGGLASLFRGGSSSAAQDAVFADGGSVFGFAAGGYTRDADRRLPVGVVHGREYVFDADATARIGLPTLNAIRRGVRGYARGGYVGDAWGAEAGGSGAVVNYAPVVNGSGLSQDQLMAVLQQHFKEFAQGLPRAVHSIMNDRFSRRGVR